MTKLDDPMSFKRLGRRTGHACVSSTPSKIPYVGFSPVRLQTGIPTRSSRVRLGFKPRAGVRPGRNRLYAMRARSPSSYGPFGHVKRNPLKGRSSPEVLHSPAGYVVPPGPCYYDLIRNSLSLPLAYCTSSKRIFARRLCLGWSREAPQFAPRVCSSVPPYVPRWAWWLHVTGSSPPSLAFAYLRAARHPQDPIADSQGLRHEAATFALCYGPEDCWPSIGKDFYDQAFTPSGRLGGASVMTTRATVDSRGRTFTGKTRGPMGCGADCADFAD
jgi:hypothetical protein